MSGATCLFLLCFTPNRTRYSRDPGCELDHNGMCRAAQPSVPPRTDTELDEADSTGSWTMQHAAHASEPAPRLLQEAGSWSRPTEWRLSKAALPASCAQISVSVIWLPPRCKLLKVSSTRPHIHRKLCCL